jgi:hypothetical protein
MFNEMLRDNKVDCCSTTTAANLMIWIKLKFYFLCEQCGDEEIALDFYKEGRIIRNQHELLTGHSNCKLYTEQILFREYCHNMYRGEVEDKLVINP